MYSKEDLNGKKYFELMKIAKELGLVFENNPKGEEIKEAILNAQSVDKIIEQKIEAKKNVTKGKYDEKEYVFKKIGGNIFNAINVGKQQEQYLKDPKYFSFKNLPKDAREMIGVKNGQPVYENLK